MKVFALMVVLLSAGIAFANGGSTYDGHVSFSHSGGGCRNIPDGKYFVEIVAHHPSRSMDVWVWFFGKAERFISFKIVGDNVFWPSYTDASDKPEGKVKLDGKGGTIIEYYNSYSVRFAFSLADDGSMVIVGEEKDGDDCVANFIGRVNSN